MHLVFWPGCGGLILEDIDPVRFLEKPRLGRTEPRLNENLWALISVYICE